jgi:hypothetical protein
VKDTVIKQHIILILEGLQDLVVTLVLQEEVELMVKEELMGNFIFR